MCFHLLTVEMARHQDPRQHRMAKPQVQDAAVAREMQMIQDVDRPRFRKHSNFWVRRTLPRVFVTPLGEQVFARPVAWQPFIRKVF